MSLSVPYERERAGLAPLSARLAAWLPAIVLAYPLLILPLTTASTGSGQELASLPPEPETNLANRLYFPISFCLAMLATLAIPLARLAPLRHAAIVFIGVFVVWAAASVVWAIDPGIASRRLIQQLCVLAAVVPPVLVARDIGAVIERVFIVAAAAAMLNLAYVVFLPPGPIGHEGIYSQKNMLGAAAAIFVLPGLHQAFAGRRPAMRLLGWAVSLAGAIALVASQSKTSLGLIVMVPPAALAVVVLANALRLSPVVVAGVVALFTTLAYRLGVSFALFDFAVIAETLFGDPTLTSRTFIWEFAWTMIERSPWLGYGYQSFWGIGHEAPSFREAHGFIASMPHAHNGYLDIVLQTGIPGLAILGALIMAVLHASAGPRVPFALSWLIVSTILFTIGHNLLETTWFQGYSYNWVMFVIVAAIAARLGYRHD